MKIYNDKKYRLTKVYTKPDHFSYVPVGYSEDGTCDLMRRRNGTQVRIRAERISEGLITSDISGYKEINTGYEIYTQTSTYTLEVINEEKKASNKKTSKNNK